MSLYINAVPFQQTGGYKIFPMQSPPSQRAVVKPLELINEDEKKVLFDRFNLGKKDLATGWENKRTLHGSELVEYFNAFNPLFIESDKGMDIVELNSAIRCYTFHAYSFIRTSRLNGL